MTRKLLVPGRGAPMQDHWARRWARADPTFQWAPEPPGPPYILEERVTALHSFVVADEEPALLIAHSAGCLTVSMWAAKHTGPVVAALLVTPPEAPESIVPRLPLPFRSILVASRTDQHSTFEQSERLAEAWGSELVDVGDVGHLATTDGYGPWPEGERLVQRLLSELSEVR